MAAFLSVQLVCELVMYITYRKLLKNATTGLVDNICRKDTMVTQDVIAYNNHRNQDEPRYLPIPQVSGLGYHVSSAWNLWHFPLAYN